MPLYFSYGANMDAAAMGRRCPRSRSRSLARLPRHRLALTREGWLTAIRDPRETVHGVLWDLALSDVAALDRYEGVGDGLYVKSLQPVIAETGPKRALVYFGVNPGEGAPRADYMENVIAAARAQGLPSAAIAALQALAGLPITPPRPLPRG